MSYMKRYAEAVSVEMGHCGELNSEVLTEAQRRLDEVKVDGKMNFEIRDLQPKREQ